MGWNFALAFIVAATLVALLLLLPRMWPKLKCPTCGVRAIKTLDEGFCDPSPNRSLHRCGACGAELVRRNGEWVPPSAFNNEDPPVDWSSLRQQ